MIVPRRLLTAFVLIAAASSASAEDLGPQVAKFAQEQLGKKVGVAINPATPLAVLQEILGEVDLVLCMTVDPGFGGQALIPSTVPKIERLRAMITQHHAACDLEVDGGVHSETAPLVVKAGANVLVAGSSVYGDPGGVAAGISRLRAAASL